MTNRVAGFIHDFSARVRQAWLRLFRRMPETVMLWAAWSGVILAIVYLTEVLNYPQPEWVEPAVETLVIWLNFLTWSWLLALTARTYLQQDNCRLPKFLGRIPPACLVTTLALTGGLILERASGGLLRYLRDLNPPADLMDWWEGIVVTGGICMLIMLACAAWYHLLLAVKKPRLLGKLGLYFIHQAALAYVFGSIVFIGVLLALGLLEVLFDVKHVWDWTLMWLTGCELIWPSLALLLVWPEKDFDLESWRVNKFWRICGIYLAGPLLALYDVILYVYLIKQALIRQWPEYGMTHLALWFAIGAGLWLILTDCMRKNSKSLADTFAKILAVSLVPLMALVIWGIGTRISAFGWTQPRFLVVAGVIWVLTTLYLWWRRQTIGILLSTALIALSICLLSPVVVAWSQKSLHADAWLAELYPHRHYYTGPTREDNDKPAAQVVHFYGNLTSLLRFYPDVSDYDLLVSVNNEMQSVNWNGETWTWRWSESETPLDDKVGVLLLASPSAQLTLDVTPLVAELNTQCELTNAESSQYVYGCGDSENFGAVLTKLKPHGLEHFQDGAGASWKVNLDGWEAHVLLSHWHGERDNDTGEFRLDNIEGVALLKKI